MTEISDDEAAEVTWPEPRPVLPVTGEVDTYMVDLTGNATPAHLHSWTILGVQPYTPWVVIGKPIPQTRALLRCSECGEPDTRTLPGEWTLEDLQRGQ